MNASTETHDSAAPSVAVVVPTLDGHRDGWVPRLLASIDRQTVAPGEVRLVQGVRPQGRAINEGVRDTVGEVVIILDDDAELADATVFARLIETLRSDPRIGMAGASIVVHPDANAFQRRAAHQFPRLCTPVVEEITDSDLACHGCCAIPRRVFEAVGGEREDILRGLDPDLRVRLRQAGYRVVLAPEARIHHPLPANLRALLRQFFRNGYGSAYAQKYRPDLVFDTQETVSSAGFTPKRPFGYRALRFPLRLAKALVRLQFLRFTAYVAYAFGYTWGLLTAKRIEVPGTDSNPPCPTASESKIG